jgi:hypothetical protein
MTDAVDAEFLLKMWRDQTWGRDTLETNDAGYVWGPWIRLKPTNADPFHRHHELWDTDYMTSRLRFLFAAMLGLDPRRQVMTHSKTDPDEPFAQYVRFSSAVAWIDSQGMPPGVTGIRGTGGGADSTGRVGPQGPLFSDRPFGPKGPVYID